MFKGIKKLLLSAGLVGILTTTGCDIADWEKTPKRYLDVKGREGYNVKLEEFDYHFEDVCKKLGYEIPAPFFSDLLVEIVPTLFEINNKGEYGYFFVDDIGRKVNGLYDSNLDKISLNLANGRWKLGPLPDDLAEQYWDNPEEEAKKPSSAFRFELNRYFKYHNGADDWDCADYGKSKTGGIENTCFKDYVR